MEERLQRLGVDIHPITGIIGMLAQSDDVAVLGKLLRARQLMLCVVDPHPGALIHGHLVQILTIAVK
jgi:hypothetical protein